MNRSRITAIALSIILAYGSLAVVPSVSAEGASAPTEVTAEGRKDSVLLSWQGNADAYRVSQYNKDSKKFEKVKTITGTKTVISDLEEGTYSFKVTSLTQTESGYEDGETTDKVSAKVGNITAEAPAPPSGKYTGFSHIDGKTYYYRTGKAVSGFQKIDQDYYYFNPKDYTAVKSKWLTIRDNKYYFTEDGTAATTSRKIDGKLYRFDIDGVCTNYKTAKDTATIQKEAEEKKKKAPSMPSGKSLGFSGSGSRYTYSCNVTEKGKKEGYDFSSSDAAKRMIREKLNDMRMKIVNAGFEIRLSYSDADYDVYASLTDYNHYSAYYDVYWNNELVYQYHESYTVTFKKDTSIITKVTGTAEWGKPTDRRKKEEKKAEEKNTMPSGKEVGFTGSGTKYKYSCNVTQKIKDKDHDFTTSEAAKRCIMEKFFDYRIQILSNGYTLRISKSDTENDFYASELDVGYYSTFYDVYLDGKYVYRYHEFYECTYKNGNSANEITKVTGTIEWKEIKDKDTKKDKKDSKDTKDKKTDTTDKDKKSETTDAKDKKSDTGKDKKAETADTKDKAADTTDKDKKPEAADSKDKTADDKQDGTAASEESGTAIDTASDSTDT